MPNISRLGDPSVPSSENSHNPDPSLSTATPRPSHDHPHVTHPAVHGAGLPEPLSDAAVPWSSHQRRAALLRNMDRGVTLFFVSFVSFCGSVLAFVVYPFI